ncbi:3-keto-5-aminohexanoate cleavage protein [Granulosicoccus antarcticus]|uniref:3-keto-5-aminohexanoate cleavage enzyme n=1 Tax=Granulosicoccus antarcticus IMCC3135 TaxID=1192854 RepID=A0A2Z2NRW6_9GAMM|nr:3-keto-5-aminohexanoate cleavage protein [Granulosicoccus antarcticus]ASJ72741.1 3-keto-5-aminohexanoate cleavage enzyme [Granulosicoccus antarcticus IMCC3135]
MNPTPLPKIMVAPNGARRNQKSHPSIPLTDDALVDTVVASQAAGAEGAHLHIRDAEGTHIIDAEHYRALLERLDQAVPEMYLQVTSESAGLYETTQQQDMMRALKPRYVSVAVREMVRKPEDWSNATTFYAWASDNNVQIQHILYSPQELQDFLTAVGKGDVPGNHHILLFVLGNYDGSEISKPSLVSVYTDMLKAAPKELNFDWMLCAFGKEETDCLVEAIRLGGKARIGFENSLWNADGSLAKDNAERVAELSSRL